MYISYNMALTSAVAEFSPLDTIACVQNQWRKKIPVERHDFTCTLRNVMFYNRATGT